jgi:hypothetical protein
MGIENPGKKGVDIRTEQALRLGGSWEDEDVESNEKRFETLRRAVEKAGATLSPDTKLLEVGTGTTVFLNYLRDQGVDAVGVDIRPCVETGRSVCCSRRRYTSARGRHETGYEHAQRDSDQRLQKDQFLAFSRKY